MHTSLPRLAVFVFAGFLAACGASSPQAPYGLPVVVIDQTPDYPMPGRDSDFPGGLVAALWHDGHMVRSTSPSAVGKSYIEGVVSPRERDEFFKFLSTATVRAPKIDGIPLHAATQSITIRGSGTSEWTRILPDSDSVWHETELRLLRLPLQRSNAISSGLAKNLVREK